MNFPRSWLMSSTNSRSRILRGVAISIFLCVGCLRAAEDSATPKRGTQEPSAPQHQSQTASAAPKSPQASSHEIAKADAAELSALADQLRDQLQKMNINVFSLSVEKRTEAIEKLAKKIKDEINAR